MYILPIPSYYNTLSHLQAEHWISWVQLKRTRVSTSASPITQLATTVLWQYWGCRVSYFIFYQPLGSRSILCCENERKLHNNDYVPRCQCFEMICYLQDCSVWWRL